MTDKLKSFGAISGILLFIAIGIPNGIYATAGGSIIPADRRVDWTYAGIPGGIPNRTTICTTINAATYGNGTTDATSAIQNALNNCPDRQVVYVPAGVYVVSNTIYFRNLKTLRGAGPGQTVIKHIGSNTGNVFTTYYPAIDRSNPRTVTQAVKDSQVITLSNTSGISTGTVLIVNQLNDGTDVDSNGTDGKCTFCGWDNGDRSLGQMVEVNGSPSGNQVPLKQPLHWTFNSNLSPLAYVIPHDNMIRESGLENLTVTQDSTVVSNLIWLQNAQNFWVKNVEVTNVANSSIGGYYVFQSEFRDNYIHTGVIGSGYGQGYGINFTMYSSNNLIANNVVNELDGGGIELHGGASGNVIAYNYLHDILYSFDSAWLVGSPMIEHGAHPKMNLWEGNVAYMAEGDFVWGSASHATIYRSRSKGWWNDVITTNNAAIRFAAKNYYMNIVGNVLGTTGKSDTYEYVPGQTYRSSAKYIYALGYTNTVSGGMPDAKVATTILRHGNFDYVTNSTIWDPSITDHTLPASLYLSQKPSWWCQETPWPPIGPDVTGGTEDPAGHAYKIPAQRRFEGLPCTQGSFPTPTVTPASSPPENDYDGDGDVDFLDLTYLVTHFGSSFTLFDFNHFIQLL